MKGENQMKKFILWLVISLVSAVNANGVCEKENGWNTNINYIAYYISEGIRYLGDSYFGDYERLNEKGKQISKTLHNLMVSHYVKEFKIDNKESLCAYMTVYDMGFENVLLQDEIEKFERYMAGKGKYDEYERYKDDYLLILKFFTYYRNQIPSIYDSKEIYKVVEELYKLKKYNASLMVRRFVYGKDIDDIFGYYLIGGLYNNDTFNNFKTSTKNCEIKANSKEELQKCKNLKPIAQWAESIIKQSKQKGGQK